ncbi:gp145 [Synechococcus phage syn9]|uniref:Gp145 n=1 Tax=Synechococcus phage syn9 TaxID=382359 RepID=Q0QZ80_BPSYS|nr:gp145 [Synechococcus phage syn9]ABA47116.1 gp145 [Synechococcus phage syn9]
MRVADPDEMFDEADRREKDNETEYWRKRLLDLEKGNKDEDSTDN